MPQYNGYDLITELVAADVVLVWQNASGKVKTITFANFVTSVNDLISKADTVVEVSSNTTLDATYEMVVGNAGSGFTITLPLASSLPGRPFKIANKGAGTITVTRTGGDVIADSGAAGASTSVVQYQSSIFQSDGVDTWFRLG